MKTKSILITFLALSVLTASRAATITAPNGLTSVEGNEANLLPFNIGADAQSVPSGTERYQQVYAAGQFFALQPGGEFITQIAFRPDANFGASAFSSTLPRIRIDLSTTLAAPDGLSTVFASNVGGNNTVVFGGLTGAPLALSSSFTGPAGGPKNFDIVINLTTAFFYNPAAGNLLLDVRNFGGGLTVYFDAAYTPGDAVSRVGTYNIGNVGSATADFLDTVGLVTRFTTSAPAPEPASAALLGLGSLLLTTRRRRGA